MAQSSSTSLNTNNSVDTQANTTTTPLPGVTSSSQVTTATPVTSATTSNTKTVTPPPATSITTTTNSILSNSDARWIFPLDKIENTPSRLDAISKEEELAERQQSALFISDLGSRLKV